MTPFTGLPLTATHLVGASAPSPAVRERVLRLAPSVVDVPGLVIAGTQAHAVQGSADMTVVVCGEPVTSDGPHEADQLLAEAARRLFAGEPDLGELLRPVLGLWSMVAWHAPSERLALCGHALGGHTVHWHRTSSGSVVFGDEIRDILAVVDRAPAIDPSSVASWAISWSYEDSRTVYAGVQRLRPGHAWVGGERTAARESRWYAPTPPRADEMILDLGEAVELTTNQVDAAVARAAGEGRVGVALSGGVDSSFVVSSLAAQIGTGRILALSNVFPDHVSADESDLIALTVDALGLDSEILVKGVPDVLPSWNLWTRTWKLPVGSPMMAVTNPLRERAAQLGIGRLLTGEGGDELFANWPAPWLSDLIRHGRLREAWQTVARLPHAGTGPRSRARNLREPLAAMLPPRLARRIFKPQFIDLSLLRPEFRDEVRVVEEAVRRPEHETGPYWWRGRRAAIAGFRITADVDGTLRRIARLAGVDERHPLMHDRELNETLPRIHPTLHFDHQIDRIVARHALSQRIPNDVAFRVGKRHFSDVLVDAVSGKSRAEVTGLLKTSTRLGEFFEPARIAALAADRAEFQHPGGTRVWLLDTYKLAAIEMWLRELES